MESGHVTIGVRHPRYVTGVSWDQPKEVSKLEREVLLGDGKPVIEE